MRITAIVVAKPGDSIRLKTVLANLGFADRIHIVSRFEKELSRAYEYTRLDDRIWVDVCSSVDLYQAAFCRVEYECFDWLYVSDASTVPSRRLQSLIRPYLEGVSDAETAMKEAYALAVSIPAVALAPGGKSYYPNRREHVQLLFNHQPVLHADGELAPSGLDIQPDDLGEVVRLPRSGIRWAGPVALEGIDWLEPQEGEKRDAT